MKIEETIKSIITLFDKHIRGAGDRTGVEERVNDYMREFIEPIIKKDFIVCDIGAGDCYTSDYLKNKVDNWFGINKGIDFINNKEKYNISEMDFHFIESPDNFFDLVLAVNVLEHSYMPAVILYELRRITNKYVFLDFPLAICDGGMQCNQENPDHHYLMSMFMWEKMFNIIGLHIEKKRINGGEVQYLLSKKEPAKAA